MLLDTIRETSTYSGGFICELDELPTLPQLQAVPVFAYHLLDTAKLAIGAETVRLPVIGSRPITRKQFTDARTMFRK